MDTQSFIQNCLVILTAGGESSRFKSVPGSLNVQKCAYVLPNGETMIERTIHLYKNLGFKKFLLLVYHNSESVEKLLGDGSRYGVSITYSHDPEKPVGRGGAMKHAVLAGHIPKDSYLIVHNPDDQLIGETDKIIRKSIEAHLNAEKLGASATAVMVEGVNHEFTGFKVKNSFVEEVEMYPIIKIPTHIGMTIFSPSVIPYFVKLFDTTKKSDFEAVLFPELKNEKKLAAHIIPQGSWISVNDEKGLKKLVKAIEVGITQ